MKYFILFVFTGLIFLNITVQSQTASATWALTTDGTPVTVGNITAGNIDTALLTTTGFAGHSFQSTAPAGLVLGATGPTNYPGDGTTTTADTTFTGLSNGTKPRYVQFTISPASGYNLKIDSMSIQACQNAVSTKMNVAIGYSLDGTNFTTFNTYGRSGDTLSGIAGTFTKFSVSPASLIVPNSGSLTLRIIIWRKAASVAASTAAIIANLVISGSTTPVTSIGNEGLHTPKNFELSQNYPNPFNPSTVINYQVPVSGTVAIGLYGLTGQLIKNLVDGYKAAGFYSINISGAELPSGTYFYRISTNGFIQTKKMTLLK
jgi:hypothetical protein